MIRFQLTMIRKLKVRAFFQFIYCLYVLRHQVKFSRQFQIFFFKMRAKDQLFARMQTEIILENPSQNKKIQTSLEHWEEFRSRSVFVDKTLLIHQIIEDRFKDMIVTRPKKWGKSLNLSMLKSFFNCPFDSRGEIDLAAKHIQMTLFTGENQKLLNELPQEAQKAYKRHQMVSRNNLAFNPLKIMTHWEKQKIYFANYVVFYFNFFEGGFKFLSLKEFVKKILYSKIKDMYMEHDYLSDNERYQRNMKSLYRELENDQKTHGTSFYLKELFFMIQKRLKRKIVLLVDQYDYWYSQALINEENGIIPIGQAKNILIWTTQFLGSFIKGDLKKYIEFTFITGIRPVFYFSQSSGLCYNFRTIQDSMSLQEFCGFTKQEVQSQLISPLFPNMSKENKENLVKNIERMYNGFVIRNSIKVFNPLSVMKYLYYCHANKRCIQLAQNSKLKRNFCYWVNTQSIHRLIKVHLNEFQQQYFQFYYNVFKNLLNNYDQKETNIYINRKYTFCQNQMAIHNWSKVKYTSEQLIYLLVTTGFLTIKEKIVSIPNEELRSYFQDLFMDFLIKNLEEDLEKFKVEENVQKFSIRDWSLCSKLLQKSFSKFVRMLKNFCWPLFSALMLTRYMIMCSTEGYRMLYQYRLSRIQPGIIMISSQNRSAIIQENIILKKKLSQQNMHEKGQQAIFQIFHKNYFQAIFAQEAKSSWDQVIVRGVVGHKLSGKPDPNGKLIQLFAVEKEFTKKQAESLQKLSVFLFTHQKHNISSLAQTFLPRFYVCQQKVKQSLRKKINQAKKLIKSSIQFVQPKEKLSTNQFKTFNTTIDLLTAASQLQFSEETLRMNKEILDQTQRFWNMEKNQEDCKPTLKGKIMKMMRELYKFQDIKRTILIRFCGFYKLEDHLVVAQDLSQLFLENGERQKVQKGFQGLLADEVAGYIQEAEANVYAKQ